jgi:hypothetical protein
MQTEETVLQESRQLSKINEADEKAANETSESAKTSPTKERKSKPDCNI